MKSTARIFAAVLVAAAAWASLYGQGGGFEFLGVLARVVTPNGDGRNDVAILCYDNPRDSAVRARVFDLRGQAVSEMTRVIGGAVAAQCPPPSGPAPQREAALWDGRSGGKAVPSGIYVYQLQSESVSLTGTLVVAR